MHKKILLISVLIILSFVSILVGPIEINLLDIFNDVEQFNTLIISRIPRLITIILTGIALSISGLIMQKLVMNNFVSPSTGATISSAQFGILVSLLIFAKSSLVFKSIFAFAFSILGTILFISFINAMNFKNKMLVPLVGIMFNYILSSLTSFIAYKFSLTQTLSNWTMGNFSMIIKGRYEILYLTLPMIIISFIYAKYFNIVGMGKNISQNLGISYKKIIILGLSISAIMTASTVVVVGSISYIGLIIPNIVGLYMGDDIKKSIFYISIIGANYLLLCDILARLIIYPYEIPVELISGIVGSIFFIILLLDKSGNINLKKLDMIKNLRKKYGK